LKNNWNVFARLDAGRPLSLHHAHILELRALLYSYGAISVLTGAPYSTVASICQKAKQGTRLNVNKKLHHEVIAHRKIGLSYGHIARKFKVSIATVQGISKRNGLGGKTSKN
jgi:hypothetical protein